uniref:Uncharacterized protein n=1 Tax=Steinernema glaseri TaxID=37863 RepID=A0A1I7YPC9_9BILA
MRASGHKSKPRRTDTTTKFLYLSGSSMHPLCGLPVTTERQGGRIPPPSFSTSQSVPRSTFGDSFSAASEASSQRMGPIPPAPSPFAKSFHHLRPNPANRGMARFDSGFGSSHNFGSSFAHRRPVPPSPFGMSYQRAPSYGRYQEDAAYCVNCQASMDYYNSVPFAPVPCPGCAPGNTMNPFSQSASFPRRPVAPEAYQFPAPCGCGRPPLPPQPSPAAFGPRTGGLRQPIRMHRPMGFAQSVSFQRPGNVTPDSPPQQQPSLRSPGRTPPSSKNSRYRNINSMEADQRRSPCKDRGSDEMDRAETSSTNTASTVPSSWYVRNPPGPTLSQGVRKMHLPDKAAGNEDKENWRDSRGNDDEWSRR